MLRPGECSPRAGSSNVRNQLSVPSKQPSHFFFLLTDTFIILP